MKKYDEDKTVSFYERNRKIKQNLLKVYIATLALGVVFIAVKGFI